MRNKLLLLAGLLLSGFALHAQDHVLMSPDKRIKVSINIGEKIGYSVSCQGETLLKGCYLGMTLSDAVLGKNPKLTGHKYAVINEESSPILPIKYSTVKNRYNQLTLRFRGNYSVEFRAFDDGVAYRFVTEKESDIEVMGEDFAINFPYPALAHLQQPRSFKTAYEEVYTHVETDTWNISDRMAVLPVLIDTRKGYKLLVSESDLRDYPCMFLQGTGDNGMRSLFPKVPLEFGEDGDRSLKIVSEADYIAKTTGKRSFPWRYIVIAAQDGQLIETMMGYKLSSKNELADISWIKPGRASWEWWNDASPYGPDVDFVSGYNLDTYKYYIDFASKFGIEYIVMDEGWAKSTRDPYTPNPAVDVYEIIRYGKEKGVGVVLWLTWLAVENNFELFKTFNEWGVKGVKIDFMDRSDQWMVNYYERVAREAAKYNLFVDFHGSFKPAGLEYRYPNVVSYEGVRGMEQMGGCFPDNSVYFPFIRNVTGAMDYTPGAMISMQPEVYSAKRPNSASIGTRAYQMALFVIFESPLQMMADNPTLYYRNEECTEFITRVPTTWDETMVLDAKVGEYAVVAKRKGEVWFIGGMTNNGEKERLFQIDLDFLKDGRSFEMTSFEDGVNAGRQAMDYRKKVTQVGRGDAVTVKMVRNGGWVAVLK
jgi:alpha-glucosidase